VPHGQNVTVDVTIGSKCHCGRSELGRNVQAAARTPASLTLLSFFFFAPGMGWHGPQGRHREGFCGGQPCGRIPGARKNESVKLCV
jgi:hypothetical protein